MKQKISQNIDGNNSPAKKFWTKSRIVAFVVIVLLSVLLMIQVFFSIDLPVIIPVFALFVGISLMFDIHSRALNGQPIKLTHFDHVNIILSFLIAILSFFFILATF